MTNKELLAKVEQLESRIEWLETANKKNIEVISLLLEDYKSKAKKMTYIAIDGTKYELDVEGVKKQAKELKANSKTKAKTETVKTKTQKEWDSVGNISYQGKYVKVTNIKNKTVRWAIQQTIKDFGGVKLTTENPVCKACKDQDKYCQVYEFKTIGQCEKFIADQRKRVG